MKSIYDIFNESLLGDVESSLSNIDTAAKMVNALSGSYELEGIAGVGYKEEKLFGPKISQFEHLPYISDKFIKHGLANEYKQFPNYKSFAKFLERLQPEDIGWSSFNDIPEYDAPNLAGDINDYAKKNGIIKKEKNVVVQAMIFDNGGEKQLQIYVTKLDKNGEIYRDSRGARCQLMYVFYHK